MAITKTQLGGAIAVVGGIFLFKSLSVAPILGDFITQQWWIVAIIALFFVISHDKIAGMFIK